MIMEQTIGHCTVACLRLQQVLPLCEKAIERFRESAEISKPISMQTFEKQPHHAYAWIDRQIFVDMLASLLKDIYKSSNLSSSDITISINLIGTSMCRILVSDCTNPSLFKCTGPVDLADKMLVKYDIEYLKSTIALHGGYFQVWKKPDNGHCLFEINLICMNDCERGDYDYLEA